jgi:hypothetical protein
MPVSADAVPSEAMHALNDWSRPTAVRRFAALVEKVGADPWAGLTVLGQMTWPDGADIDVGAELAGWPDNPRAVLTEVLAGYDAANLYVRVVCEEPHLNRMQLGDPEIWRNDHIEICIDPRHDHWRFCQLTILPDGRMESAWNTLHSGFVPADLRATADKETSRQGDKQTRRQGDKEQRQEIIGQARREDGRWVADVTVPWKAIELENVTAGQCVGLNVSRWRTTGCEQAMQWSPTFGLPQDARLFGDLYLGAPAAILQEVRLGGPNWGSNRGYAKFIASQPFCAWIEPGDSVEPVKAEATRLEANQYGLAGYQLHYRIDPRDIMRGQLTLKWSGEQGGALSQASFVFGWKRSVLLTHAAGREEKVERPGDGAAPGFFARMCDHLLARLPRYRREGGRYLVSEDGARIDLLGSDPLVPMAKAVAERIEGQADQVAACSLVLCQPEVLISSGSLARAGARGNPASVLWTRGTFCDVYSMMVAELVERVMALQGLRVKTGLVYLLRPEGASLEWPNHFWGGVWLEHGVTIVDAELGRFFYRRDGKTLATLDDLFEDPSLAEASGTGLGDYFRLHRPEDVVIRYLPRWREVRPV